MFQITILRQRKATLIQNHPVLARKLLAKTPKMTLLGLSENLSHHSMKNERKIQWIGTVAL